MKKLLLSILFISGLSASAQFWTPKATGYATVSRGVGSISIPDANNIWVTATDGSGGASTTVKEISRSTDGGETWTPTVLSLGPGTAGLGVSSVCAISGTTAWISLNPGTGGIGGVWKTTNSGGTFTKQTTAAFASDSFTNFVYFWDANNGVAQGDPQGGYFEIWTTSNGGTNWTRVPSANIPATLPAGDEYGYTDNYFVSGNTIWFGTSSGRLFKSTNFGLNWTVAQTPLTDFGTAAASGSCAFSSTTNGLLVSSAGAIYSTSDGGATFTPIATTGFFSGDIAYVPGTTGTYVSTGTGSSYTLNSGLTWTNIDAIQHTKVEFLNTSVGFTGGFTTSATSGGISKYTGTELKTDSFVSKKFSTFPNPANDVVTISNSDNILFSEIAITDMNGRTIKNIKVGDLSEFQINVSDLNAGVYFMSITSNEGIAVKKFIKN